MKEQLRRRAKSNGRSMEDEVRHILRDAGNEKPRKFGLGTQIAARFRGIGVTLQELPKELPRPATFDE